MSLAFFTNGSSVSGVTPTGLPQAYTGPVGIETQPLADSGMSWGFAPASQNPVPLGYGRDEDGNSYPLYDTGTLTHDSDGNPIAVTTPYLVQPGGMYIAPDGTLVFSYDTAIYPAPIWAALDWLGGPQGTARGLAAQVQALGLDPTAVLKAIGAWVALSDQNQLRWQGSVPAFLLAAAQGDPTLAPVIMPFVAANSQRLTAGQQFLANQWVTGHPRQSDTGIDYVEYLAAMAIMAAPAVFAAVAAAGAGGTLTAVGGGIGAEIGAGTALTVTVSPALEVGIQAAAAGAAATGTLGASAAGAGLEATVITSAPLAAGESAIVTVGSDLSVTFLPESQVLLAPLQDVALVPTTTESAIVNGSVIDLNTVASSDAIPSIDVSTSTLTPSIEPIASVEPATVTNYGDSLANLDPSLEQGQALVSDPGADPVVQQLSQTVQVPDLPASPVEGATVNIPAPETSFTYTAADGTHVAVDAAGNMTLTETAATSPSTFLDAAKAINGSQVMQTLRLAGQAISLISTLAKLYTASAKQKTRSTLAAQRAAALGLPATFPISQGGAFGGNSFLVIGFGLVALLLLADSRQEKD